MCAHFRRRLSPLYLDQDRPELVGPVLDRRDRHREEGVGERDRIVRSTTKGLRVDLDRRRTILVPLASNSASRRAGSR